jgi:RNA polymerase sigma factor (sigma-70 family)
MASVPPINDEHARQLLSLASNNERAFKALYDLFSNRVYNTAISYTHNEHDAEELVQEIFVKIHRSATTFKEKSLVSTWIYRITVNKCLDFLRHKKRLRFLNYISLSSIDNKPPIDFNHPGIILENKEKAALLFKKIDLLSAQQKTAFLLSYIEQLPRQQVADIMELSLKAVESLLQRAKANLRKHIGKR